MKENKFKRWYQAGIRRLLNAVFARELQGFKSQIENLEAKAEAQRRLLDSQGRSLNSYTLLVENMTGAMDIIRAGGVANPAGSWCVLGYSQGDRDYVKFYDFGKNNIGGLRQMVEAFRKAGIAVLLEGPFKPERSLPRG